MCEDNKEWDDEGKQKKVQRETGPRTDNGRSPVKSSPPDSTVWRKADESSVHSSHTINIDNHTCHVVMSSS